MAGSIPSDNQSDKTTDRPLPIWLRGLHGLENGLLVICLFALIFLPLAERILRGFFNTGIQGEAEFVLHFSLVIGMIGGAIAAREQRLLAISTIAQFLKGPWKISVNIFANSWATVITGVLAYAGWQFLQDEKGAGN